MMFFSHVLEHLENNAKYLRDSRRLAFDQKFFVTFDLGRSNRKSKSAEERKLKYFYLNRIYLFFIISSDYLFLIIYLRSPRIAKQRDSFVIAREKSDERVLVI